MNKITKSRHRILITGSAGLIGTALREALLVGGYEVVGLDPAAEGAEQGDVRNMEQVRTAVAGCTGIIHLAAMSRVVWGERDPTGCWTTNVDGLQNVLDAAQEQPSPSWTLFSSSREVYGQPDRLPVAEDFPLRPLNIYGRSKVEGERMMVAAKDHGQRTAIVRFSNVYGSVDDHADRVVPAFARAAVVGGELRVDGAECVFDFTYIDDVVRGVVAMVDRLEVGENLPPIHLVTGQPTTLGELAELTNRIAGGTGSIVEAPPRDFDVHRFYGDPSRAAQVLGWRAEADLQQGLEWFIDALRTELA